MKSGRKFAILVLTVAGAVVLALAIPPIAQDPAYHRFADTREFFGVPNFFDVVSNAGFLLVGLLGVHSVFAASETLEVAERRAYFTLFVAIIATGFGSAYYHLAPDNARLFWDRLPLAIVVMAFTSAIISERASAKTATAALIILTLTGAASVFYWRASEIAGQGDLRFYGLVQFLPMLLVPLMVWFFPSRHSGASNLVWVLAWYGVAKACEHFDSQILSATGMISGHTLKHVFAALALYFILRMVQARRRAASA
ncbi:MAG: hypothetical protein ACREV9_02380 [Burkholderiales bacterium]